MKRFLRRIRSSPAGVGWALKNSPGCPFVPGMKRTDDPLHVHNALNSFEMALRPVESQGRSPVVYDQNDVVC
jgi:hypothetical protein